MDTTMDTTINQPIPTDTDIAITAAAERIAMTTANAIDLAIDPDELASLCAAVGTEAQRIATVELRRIADTVRAEGKDEGWGNGWEMGYQSGLADGASPNPTDEYNAGWRAALQWASNVMLEHGGAALSDAAAGTESIDTTPAAITSGASTACSPPIRIFWS